MKIKKKGLNVDSFCFNIEPKEIEKAYQEGIYSDSTANRKLGRVGMTYAAYAEKVKKEKNLGIESKKPSTKDSGEEAATAEKKVNSKNATNSREARKKSRDDINESDFEKSLYKKENRAERALRERGIGVPSNKVGSQNDREKRLDSIIEASSILNKLSDNQLSNLIDYADISGLDLKNGDRGYGKMAKRVLAYKYIKSAELSGNIKEVANSLDEILEDAMDDYTPKNNNNDEEQNTESDLIKQSNELLDAWQKQYDNLEDGDPSKEVAEKWVQSLGGNTVNKRKDSKTESNNDKKSSVSLSSVVENSKIRSMNSNQLNAIIDYSGFNIKKNISDDAKMASIAKNYIKSAKLEGSAKDIANSLDEILEDSLDDYISNNR